MQSSRKNAAKIPVRYFAFFLISGFCSLLYEVIRLRLAMAQFAVTITMTSTVISVFMAGLGVGSWMSGKLTRSIEERSQFPRLRAYALTEFLIGIGSLIVPYELLLGRRLLQSAGLSSSVVFYAIAGLWLAAALLPWCICMGATFPIAMWAIREHASKDSDRSFAYLYVANVLGAFCGAVLPLFLIEFLGFRSTLRIGGILNLLLAAWAFALSKRGVGEVQQQSRLQTDAHIRDSSMDRSRLYLVLLFATGLTSMGMEVVWIRLYTPYLGPEVYAFATILGIYLASTALGPALVLWYLSDPPSRRSRFTNKSRHATLIQSTCRGTNGGKEKTRFGERSDADLARPIGGCNRRLGNRADAAQGGLAEISSASNPRQSHSGDLTWSGQMTLLRRGDRKGGDSETGLTHLA